jgi:membrane fusion protein (multidrug efflux system)
LNLTRRGKSIVASQELRRTTVAQINKKIVVPVVILAVLAVGLWAGLSLMRPGGGGRTAAGVAGARPGGGGTVVAAANKEDAPAVAKEGAKEGDAKDDAKKEKAPVPVSVAPIEVGAVSSYITATANLVAESEVKILAEAEGRVDALNIEEGQRAAAGSVLASLVRDDAEFALKKAAMRAANTELIYKRAQEVVVQNLISREQFDKVGLDNDIAQQELAEARWRLEKTSIKAPFAGRVTERTVKLGQHVRPGDVLFTIADFDPLVARIYLAEKDIYGLREGREVRITLKANDETRFRGRIRQISPVVDVATGTVKVTVEAVAPPAEVRPGAFVTVDIVRTTHPNARLVPREAVIRELQDTYVFVAVEGVARKRPIELGLEEDSRIEAVQGLEPGEQVIVAGQGGLKDGAAVKVIVAPQASDLGRPDDRVRTLRG